jgi:hypothetical protein
MLDLLLRAALAALLVAFLFPLFTISRLNAGFAFTEAAVPTRRRRRTAGDLDPRAKWSADEFAFERAIEAYEELIDRTAGRLP